MKKVYFLSVLLLFINVISAQDSLQTQKEEFKPTLKLKGFTHLYFSAGESNSDDFLYGFSVRRVRVIPYGNLSEKITYKIQFAFDKQTPTFLDATLQYNYSDLLQFQVGQFATPGPRTSALSSKYFGTSNQLFSQRAGISQEWFSQSGTKSGRDLGMEVHGKVLDKSLYYAVMFANPITTSLFTPSVKSGTLSHNDNGLKIVGRLEYYLLDDDLAIGGSACESSYTSSGIDNKIQYYSGHAIYRSDKLNVISEYILGNYGMKDSLIGYNGFMVDLAYSIGKIQPAVRFDLFSPLNGDPDGSGVEQYSTVAFGVNYYMNKKITIYADYYIRNEKTMAGIDDLKNNLFLINFQFKY